MLFDVRIARADYLRLVESRYPRSLERLMDEALGLREGRFELLGQSLRLTEKPDWHRDPVGGEQWPLRVSERINIAAKDRPADVKYVWELNRHQHLTTFALAFRMTGDELWLECAVLHIESWIQRNPEGIGINWKSAMEIAIRVISWITVLSIAGSSNVFSRPERKRRMLRSLHQQLSYLERNLSPEFDERNNHSIGEAAGLILGGLMFPEFVEADRWYESGLRLLESELTRQVEADGADFEHSTSYHRFVLEFAMIVWQAHRALGLELPWLPAVVARMTEFLIAMQRPDGRITALGDGDEGRGFRFGSRSGYDAKHVISSAAVMLRREDFKSAAGTLDWEAFHFLGPDAVHAFDALSPGPPILSHAFRDSGFYVMRSGCDHAAAHCVFDCGYLGCGPSGGGGHGHNDQLTFEYSTGGFAWVTDSGTFTYLGDDQWRRYFRSSAAHSTVQIDHLEAAEFGYGHFRFLTRPAARARDWLSTPQLDRVVGYHNGYERLSPPVTVGRELVLLKSSKALLVCDSVLGGGRRKIGLRFQIARGVLVQLKGSSCRVSSDQTTTQIEFALDPRLRWTVAEGWVSPSYGVRERRPVLYGEGVLDLPTEFATFIIPVEGSCEVSPARIREACEVVPASLRHSFDHAIERLCAR